jgi:hypothetical protein
MALLVGCADDGSPSDPSPNDPTPGGETKELAPREYCSRVCDRAKTCDEAFDRQTCERQCQRESGVLVNLNPALAPGFYECVEDTSCSSVGNHHFLADCLASAAQDVDLPKEGENLCKALEKAADECGFTDYNQQACRTAVSAYAEGALVDAAVCAQKKCDLVFPCLDATLGLPSELNDAPIGFTERGLSSAPGSRPAVELLFPRSAGAAREANPGATPTPSATTPKPSEDQTSESNDTSDSTVTTDDCDDCLENQCGSEVDACVATDACVELYGVFVDCLNDQRVTEDATTCFFDYVEAYHPTNVESLTALTNLMSCIEGSDCSALCN